MVIAEAAPVHSSDRLGMTLFLALIAHAIVILGVGFAPHDRPRFSKDSLEIILVQSRSEKAPDKADYLAQASQDGGGQSEQKERPSTPVPAPYVAEQARIPDVAPPVTPSRPKPETRGAKTVVTRKQADRKVRARPVGKSKAKPQKVVKRERPRPKAEPRPRLTPAALLAQTMDMASLDAEIDRKLRAYAERPRRKFINARTREAQYAAYMDAWRAKVERVGNLNYPDEARRHKLSGSLRLEVALRPDGSIADIVIRSSSGKTVLDDAARNIVRLAAPYAEFPQQMRRQVDLLHIERTWQFLSDNRLASR